MRVIKPSHYSVHKFGGSSLIDSESYRIVSKRLSGKNELIVVSATQGTTHTLQQCLDHACEQEPVHELLNQLKINHLAIIHDLFPNAAPLIKALDNDINMIRDLLHAIGMIRDYSPEQQAVVLGFGEQWSAKILTQLLAIEHHAVYLNSSTVLFVNKQRGNLYVDWKKSQEYFNHFIEKISPVDQIVVTGFFASDENGKQVILGRNGSDYSAAIFSKLIYAKELMIWKDTDGIFSADPTRVRSAFPIEALSYESALELAYFGASVIHPKTIGPAMELNIPIHIKNTLNPSAKGTVISSSISQSPLSVQGITSINEIALISIEGTGLIGVSGTAARVFSTLEHAGISVILISQASSEHSICFAVEQRVADQAINVLSEAFAFEIAQKQVQHIRANKHCSILAVVGDKMVGTIGIAEKLTSTLTKASVNIIAIAQGASERNISLVVDQKDINKALRAVHAGFYLSDKTLSVGIIGPGLVGSTLIKQMAAELDRLRTQHHIKIEVRGICNSSQMLLSEDPISLTHWKAQLNDCNVPTSFDAFADHIISADIPHAVIIDCSASQQVADQYVNFINKGAHVITPNKRANSGDYDHYMALRKLLREKNRNYLYETTVCAGLPIMTTLHDIIQTGDTVLRIDAVVSGTLSYIFNQLADGFSFSEVIRRAKENGYTEPDPRDDLTGMDVARKMVILARELGYSTGLNDIAVENLVPETLRDCDSMTFLTKLPEFDQQIKAHINTKMSPGERVAYVGSITEDGKVTVGIQSFPQQHPLAQLKGTDNILILKTKRYNDQPLIIQGPGAGADVTAAGVFADLLRLISFICK